MHYLSITVCQEDLTHLHSESASEGIVRIKLLIRHTGPLCHPVKGCQVMVALRLSAKLLLTLDETIRLESFLAYSGTFVALHTLSTIARDL